MINTNNRAALEALIAKYTDYVECEEWHIHQNDDGIPANADATDGHREFDEDKFLEALTALLRQAEREGCPCLLTEPCSYVCTCANPVMSGGCMRCCKYGSLEQRKASASRLAALQTEEQR